MKYQPNALIYRFFAGVGKARIAQLVTLVNNVTSTHDPRAYLGLLVQCDCSCGLFLMCYPIPLCNSFLSSGSFGRRKAWSADLGRWEVTLGSYNNNTDATSSVAYVRILDAGDSTHNCEKMGAEIRIDTERKSEFIQTSMQNITFCHRQDLGLQLQKVIMSYKSMSRVEQK